MWSYRHWCYNIGSSCYNLASSLQRWYFNSLIKENGYKYVCTSMVYWGI